MRKTIKIAVLFYIMVIFLCITGCKRNKEAGELKVYGGDLIRYSVCFEDNKSLLMTFPVITNKKVSSISFNGYKATENSTISVKVNNINIDEYEKYKNYYIYFVILDFSCVKDVAVNTRLDKLFLEIDGTPVVYETPYVDIKNTTYYCENNDYLLDDGVLFLDGEIFCFKRKMP